MLFKNIEVNGLKIFYREAGKATRPSLSFCTASRPRRINTAT